MKRLFYGFLILCFFAFMSGAMWLYYQAQPPQASHASEPAVIFDLSRGPWDFSIAQALEDRGLIRSAFVFDLYVRFFSWASLFHYGKHELSIGMTYEKIVQTLSSRTQGEAISITFKEGQTRFDLAKMLYHFGFAARKKDVLDLIKDDTLVKELINPLWASSEGEKDEGRLSHYSLEGYLFPNTYFFSPGTPLIDILRTMVDTFKAKFTETETVKHLQRLGINSFQWVSLASMVEAEAQDPSEHLTIASLYLSRWRYHKMPMQCDPTVKYGLIIENRWRGSYAKSIVKRRARGGIDWESFESPYNTYHSKVRGLPAGPIGNPGERALRAVFKAEKTEIRYMYADPKRWGHARHCFSKNQREHLDCVRGRRSPPPSE